jgi:hypothetical protein
LRRRRDLTGWILMAVLFVGAMALIFYILLLRAQHLASREQERMNPEPQGQMHILAETPSLAVLIATPASAGELVSHELQYEASPL